MTLLFFLLAWTNPDLIDTQFRAHIRFLADDLLEGRDTTERGQRIAARYLATQMALNGIEPAYPDSENPYMQPFALEADELDKEASTLSVHGAGDAFTFRFRKDFDSMTMGGYDKEAPITFVGFGLEKDEYSDYEGVDVKGHWVLILEGTPRYDDDDSVFAEMDNRDFNAWRRFRRAREKGAVGVVYLKKRAMTPMGDAGGLRLKKPGATQEKKDNPFFMVRVAKERHDHLYGSFAGRIEKAIETIQKEGKPQSFTLTDRKLKLFQKAGTSEMSSENVVGLVPGHHPELRNEYVVISAHYDHVGTRNGKVYNGADDNASGTTMVLLLGQHLKTMKLKRSIILLLVSGEEKGLLGSEYFVKHPNVPLEQIVANVNLDMLGRNETHTMGVIPAQEDKTNGVSSLTQLALSLNNEGEFGYEFNTGWDRYHRRSDHYNFTRSGVPAVFFFAGTHEDYHAPGDDWDKLNYEKLVRFYHFLETFVTRIGNAAEKPVFISQPDLADHVRTQEAGSAGRVHGGR